MSKLSELKSESAARTAGARAKPSVGRQSCDILVRLEGMPDTQAGQLVLRGAPLFDGPHAKAGQSETFVVRPDRVKECLDNLNKGAGTKEGSILALGNAWRDQERGHISIGWINTAVSAQKAQAGMNYHHRRRVEQVFAQMPVLDFTNVNRAAGEPERVRWPLGLDRVEARATIEGRWQTVSFDRTWLKAKLDEAWAARAQETVSVNLRLPVLRTEQALPVHDAESAAAAIGSLLDGQRFRSLLTRLNAGGEIDTRWQPLMQGEDVGEWAAKLLGRTQGYDGQGRLAADAETGEAILVDRFSLVQGINNDMLFDACRQGQITVEFIPRDMLLVASKNAVGLANDVKAILQSQAAADLRSVAFAFGDDPQAVSRVALILQRQDDRTYVVAGPFRLDTGPAHSLTTVPTPHWKPPAAPAPEPEPEPEPPLEPATAADIPELEEGDFELDAAAIDAALVAGSAVEPRPASASSPTLGCPPAPGARDAAATLAPMPAPARTPAVAAPRL